MNLSEAWVKRVGGGERRSGEKGERELPTREREKRVIQPLIS